MKVTDVKHGYRGPKHASFDDIKRELLRLLENARKKGVVDAEANPYLDLINSNPDYVTSSSCYGRIILIDLPNYTKKDSNFLWKQHNTVSVDDAWAALQSAEGKFVWLKADPLILHVSCRDIDAANALLKVKACAGMKRGGIFSIAENRVQIELEGTYRMEVPVKKEGESLVDKNYFSLLIENANAKFEKNAAMWERFAGEFSSRLEA
ncbi:MAG: hypothetical protein KAW41_06490 [Candidatus Diapherotrites archaeon]|nr:hypothetical protein [Candidatus Diapherotrites archaeon]